MSKNTRAKGKLTVSSENLPEAEESQELNGAEILRLLKKLEKTLDDVVTGQNTLEAKLESLAKRMDQQQTDIMELQNSANFYSHEISVISESNNALIKVMKDQQSAIDNYSAKISSLESMVDDSQRYSRSYNLRFVGIPEEIESQSEDCIDKIQQLIHMKLNLKVDIENAHRLGKNLLPDKPRHVIAKFIRRPDRYAVLHQRKVFQEENVKVFEDLIPKDLEARRKLKSIVQQARDDGKKTRFIKGDLIIDGEKYIPANT